MNIIMMTTIAAPVPMIISIRMFVLEACFPPFNSIPVNSLKYG